MVTPVVQIRQVFRSGRGYGYVIWCQTDDCDFAEHVFQKTDAQSIQRAHIRTHRLQAIRAKVEADDRPTS